MCTWYPIENNTFFLLATERVMIYVTFCTIKLEWIILYTLYIECKICAYNINHNACTYYATL